MKAVRDITIRRCTLRVARRGGWSWGAETQSLVKRAVERLPALLERRLAAMADSLPEHTEIATPVQLRIVMTRQDWVALQAGADVSQLTQARLEAAFEEAVERALPAELSEELNAQRGATGSIGEAQRAEAAQALAGAQVLQTLPSALWKLLAQWRADRKLVPQLAMLDAAVLRLWLEGLIDLDTPGRPDLGEEVDLAVLWREVRAAPLLLPAGSTRELAFRILWVIELRSRWNVGGPQLRKLLAEVCDVESSAQIVIARPAHETAGEHFHSRKTGTAADLVVAAQVTTETRLTRCLPVADSSFEVDIPCALPFLLLTPLSRGGYLSRLAAALEAANASGFAPGVALGLAHKCLAAPQRGWLRETGPLAAAAAFAGLRSADNELILGAGRTLRAQSGLLDGGIAQQLLSGHRAGAGWLLARHASDSMVLFDEDGLAPVATGTLGRLATRIAPSGAVLFVPANVASAEHLDALDDLQIPYSSDANLKTRAGCSGFVARNGARLWISKHGSQEGRARDLAERGSERVAVALANWRALHDERPALRPGLDPAFEISLSLAAGYALSAIAWSLWPDRASSTALAVIEKFADLDARVRVTPERVHVMLPMGRRAWDLRDRGLLGDAAAVPWLGARTVTFGVG